MKKTDTRIVVIGGGTGSFTLLSALKSHFKSITALVNMADDGGSTGILRDELGVLPPGDVRQCLVALARSPNMRDLFSYRFEEGSLAGHNFGNLFLTAVEKMTSNFADAVTLASDVLNVNGRVIPITLDNVTLVMEQDNGEVSRGQHVIEGYDFGGSRRPHFTLEPGAAINPDAASAIAEAELIVIAPGNLYASLAPALVVNGVAEALAQSNAQKVYVCNLVTKPGQTDGFKVADFADEIERFIGHSAQLDYVLYNNAKPDAELLERYAREGEFWVEFDEASLSRQHYKAVGGHFVSDTPWQPTAKKDLIPRTLIRHNAEAVARQLLKLAQGEL